MITILERNPQYKNLNLKYLRIKDLSCKTDYDKDLWRKGKTKEELLEKWNKICRILENAYETI